MIGSPGVNCTDMPFVERASILVDHHETRQKRSSGWSYDQKPASPPSDAATAQEEIPEAPPDPLYELLPGHSEVMACEDGFALNLDELDGKGDVVRGDLVVDFHAVCRVNGEKNRQWYEYKVGEGERNTITSWLSNLRQPYMRA